MKDWDDREFDGEPTEAELVAELVQHLKAECSGPWAFDCQYCEQVREIRHDFGGDEEGWTLYQVFLEESYRAMVAAG